MVPSLGHAEQEPANSRKVLHAEAHSPRPVPVRTVPAHSESMTVSAARRAFHFAAAQHEADSSTRLTPELLVKRGVVNLRDLEKVAPNLSIQSVNGTGTMNFYLRGMGMRDFTQNNVPSVMPYLDDVAFPIATFMSGMMFDLAGVEVTPGPVGFTHGLADTGGEVNLHTADPTRTWHGGASEDIASYARSRTNFFVSGPLAHNLFFRLAGQMNEGGAWQYSPSHGRYQGAANEGALRAKLQWLPDEKTDIMVTGHWMDDESETTLVRPVANFQPNEPYPILPYKQANWSMAPDFAKLIGRPANLVPSEHNMMWGATLRMSRDLGFARLTSISSYNSGRIAEYTDQDGTTWHAGDSYRNINGDLFSQEVQLKSRGGDAPLQWVVGMYYNRTNMNQSWFYDQSDTNKYLTGTSYLQKQQTFSQYAHVSYRLPGRVTLFAGINHESDDRHIQNVATSYYYPDGTTSVARFAPQGALGNQVTFETGAQWQALSNLMFYFKISKGFKPGGFTANTTQVQDQLAPFKPETDLGYEVGFKSDIIPNRFRLNGALFYYDYHDQQYLSVVALPVGILAHYVNIPKSYTYGVEFNAELHPLDHVYIMQNFGYMRGEYQVFQALNKTATTAQHAATGIWSGIYSDYAGADAGMPKLTLNGSADYRLPVWGKYEWETGVDWMYRSQQQLAPRSYGAYCLPPYFQLGAHTTFRPANDRWSVTVYASNLLNRQYFESGAITTTTYFWIPGPPRFVGGRFGINF
ncbi:TonB-dependent receptor [Gluconacetobacter liquefaciens]|nr:TonB-dependent receptor [Gluconacetobacter liquefaciens]